MRTDTMTVRDEMWAGRVDRAWKQGFDAGRERWRRIALIEALAAVYALWLRRDVPMIVKLASFWLMVLIGFLVVMATPLIVAGLLIRWEVRRRRAKRPSPPPAALEPVTLEDGSTF